MKHKKKKDRLFEPIDRKELWKRLAVGVLAVLILGGLYFYTVKTKPAPAEGSDTGISYEQARVIDILEEDLQVNTAYENTIVGKQLLEFEILTGPYAGDTPEPFENVLSVFHNYNILAKKDDVLIVKINSFGDNQYEVGAIENYHREPSLWMFAIVFALILIVVGWKQGIAAVAGLALTLGAVVFVLLPLLVQCGWPTVPTTVLIVALTMFTSYVFIGGLHTKAMTSCLGAFCGVLVAGLCAWGAGKIVHISGMNMDEASAIYSVGACANGLTVRNLFICGILIAAEGAVMDIAMSVVSSIEEVHRIDPTLSSGALFRSGMRVGRDAMGTMANTLILAFAGASLNMMLYLYAIDVSYNRLIDSDFIAMEVIQALAGSVGMILAVPLCALIAGVIFAKKKKTA
ncbi:MAG: YibE/F family protein [Clostridia bacterium]|nr:YibE/F family protein [Clostridia bacterium]